jgi:hypothetical protein
MIMKQLLSFSVLSIVLSLLVATSAQAVAPGNVAGLLGTWHNINPNTSGIVKVEVWNTAHGLRFRSFGACSPRPCIHTVVRAYPHSASVGSNTATGFTAFRNNGFKYVRFFGKRYGNFLRLDQFSTFAAGDTRKNYTTTEFFRR